MFKTILSFKLSFMILSCVCYSSNNEEYYTHKFNETECSTSFSTECDNVYEIKKETTITKAENIYEKIEYPVKFNEEEVRAIYPTRQKPRKTIMVRTKKMDYNEYNVTEINNSTTNRKNTIYEIGQEGVYADKSTISQRNTSQEIEQETAASTTTEKTNTYNDNANDSSGMKQARRKTATSIDDPTIYETIQETTEITTMRTKKTRTIILQELQNHTRSVDIKDHPYVVSIQKEMIHSCCGTIVNSFWILSAAHCLTLPGSTLRLVDVTQVVVVAGQSQLGLGKMQLRRVRDVYLHSRFVKKLLLNDIGMINLFQPFDLNDFVNVVQLSSSISKPYKFFGNCHLVSWTVYRKDFLSFDKLIAEDENNRKLFRVPELQMVDLPTITDGACFDRLGAKEFLTQHDHICTEYGTYKNVACPTDAGSPLICGDRQYGILSWGIGCDDYEYPGVFTNVASFRKWIDNIGTDPKLYISRNNGRNRIHSINSKFIIIALYYYTMN